MGRLTGISLFLVLVFTLIHACVSVDTLTPTQSISDGETLISAGGSYALGFFSPASSKKRYLGIWYHNIIASQTVVWVANRRDPILDSSGLLTLTANGSLIITAGRNSTVLWSSAPASLGNPVAQLLDDGNLVVKGAKGGEPESYAWQSFDHPTDTLLPGMKLGWNLTAGLNRNLTSWSSDDDPSPGDYTIAMDIRGDPQLCVWEGSVRKWRAGPWNGITFSGIPEMKSYPKIGFSFDFMDSQQEIYYKYEVTNRSIITRLLMNSTGKAQRYVWLDKPGAWSLFWYTPKTECGGFSPCGPYGVCNPNGARMCSCLPGFEPRSPRSWDLMDWSGGCVRKSPLDCRPDGFLSMSRAQLPDTAASVVNKSMSLDECRARCLSNCSCTAYASADIRGGGSGCILWVTELVGLGVFVADGQDLYVRLAAADLASMSSHSHRKGQTTVIVVVVVTVLLSLLACWIGFCLWRRKKKNTNGVTTGSSRDIDDEGDNDLELPLFDMDTIIAATDNFAASNKLGEGGFGPVYKGKLTNGQEIAVKRLSQTSLQGIDEFKNEVMLISKLQHRNLVQLLGCCVQVEERILIYEYMSNKSLDAFLFGKANSSYLNWQTRHHIILGIARGLLYLHQDSRFPIIHRDLKASNILLDEDMNPKISDFGMARIFGGDDILTKTTKVVGTYGYMSPEYAMDGIFSVKSDVFSFGVLLLEIISGQKNRGVYLSDPHQNLLGNAWSLWNEGRILELIDPSMGYSFSLSEVMRCLHVGLLCVQQVPQERPTMSSVVFMLGTDSASLAEPKQPGFLMTNGFSEGNSSQSRTEPCTVNDVTISTLVGR